MKLNLIKFPIKLSLIINLNEMDEGKWQVNGLKEKLTASMSIL